MRDVDLFMNDVDLFVYDVDLFVYDADLFTLLFQFVLLGLTFIASNCRKILVPNDLQMMWKEGVLS